MYMYHDARLGDCQVSGISLPLKMGPIVPKRRQGIATTYCATAQKRAVLIYFAAEACNHAKFDSVAQSLQHRIISGQY